MNKVSLALNPPRPNKPMPAAGDGAAEAAKKEEGSNGL
jgi:hypothetical protein